MAGISRVVFNAEVWYKTTDLSTADGLTSNLKTMVQKILQELRGGEFEVENSPCFVPCILQASLKDVLRRFVKLSRDSMNDLVSGELERHVAEGVDSFTTRGPYI